MGVRGDGQFFFFRDNYKFSSAHIRRCGGVGGVGRIPHFCPHPQDISETRKNANEVKSASLLNSRALFRFFLPLVPASRRPRSPRRGCLVFTVPFAPHVTKLEGRVFATGSHAQMKSIKMRVCALKKY